ncbi:MAG: hypothetical protein QM730_19350 [Anaerolineales bacterium]
MNIFLWALQIILAIKLLTVTFNHGLRPDPVKMQRGKARFGSAARPLLLFIAGLTLLTALGLVLPARKHIYPLDRFHDRHAYAGRHWFSPALP